MNHPSLLELFVEKLKNAFVNKFRWVTIFREYHLELFTMLLFYVTINLLVLSFHGMTRTNEERDVRPVVAKC